MSERDDRLLRLLLGVRDPLSRIELALAGAGEGQAALEARAALAEADARLEAALRLLRGGGALGEHRADCRDVLCELAERLRAPLAARGLGLEWAAPAAPVPGDPTLLRRALLCLLRAAAAWAGGEGVIRVRLAAEARRSSLHALVSGPRVGTGDGGAGATLERFALSVGAAFMAQPAAASAVSLALWLPEGVPA